MPHTRRSFLALAAASLTATHLHAYETATDPLLYVGSTTRQPNDGIHVARWNRALGSLSDMRIAFAASAPSFLAVTRHRKQPLLFAGYQGAPKVGALSSFHIGPKGDLSLVNTVTAPGADFVHLMIDHTERCLIAPNYGQGTILSCRVEPDGHLSDFVSRIQLTGHGPIAARQSAPHAHGVAIAPNNRFAYINDLGTDRILIYKLNAATADLAANDPSSLAMSPGSGPRHLAFHPLKPWAYSINELNSTITCMHWNSASGALSVMADVPTMSAGADVAVNRAGELAFDASGHFLYACNRGGAEELLTFRVGPDGLLTLLQRIQTKGKEARHFLVSPDGGYLVVAEQFSNEVAVYARDRRTGLLKPTEARYPVDQASCVLFAQPWTAGSGYRRLDAAEEPPLHTSSAVTR